MFVSAYSGHVGWMLFWAIAFSSAVHEHGYEYGKTEEQLASQSPMPNRFMKRTVLFMIALVVCGCANHREAVGCGRSLANNGY